jgi:hypothetical protein
MDNGAVQFVINDHPRFFDISGIVFYSRPADRTAYGGQADYLLSKAASESIRDLDGASLAMRLGVTLPSWLPWEPARGGDPQAVAGLRSLVQSEQQIKSAWTLVPPGDGSIDLSPLGQPGSEQSRQALRALADRGVCLPLGSFLTWVTGSETKAASLRESVGRVLPGLFFRLVQDETEFTNPRSNPFWPAEAATPDQRQWADQLADDWSLAKSAVLRRATREAIRSEDSTVASRACKSAQTAEPALVKALADGYGAYQIGMLSAIAPDEVTLTANFMVRQNYDNRSR